MHFDEAQKIQEDLLEVRVRVRVRVKVRVRQKIQEDLLEVCSYSEWLGLGLGLR